MRRTIGKLSARAVATLTAPGRHSDGGNLYLSISKDGRRRWVFFYSQHGKQREMGLGPAPDVSLARAREMAASCRRQLLEGFDPIARRDAERAASKPSPTFGEIADNLLKTLEPSWRNEKHRYQWKKALETEAKALRPLPVNTIGVDDILRILEPMWRQKPETASRLRTRIERVLNAASAAGHRSGENPARWRGNLDHLLGPRQRLIRGHHRAVPFCDMPPFITALRQRPAMAALALEFTILTAARTGEVVGATWQEIDDKARIWRVPADRMKAGKLHEVPLAPRALGILTLAQANREIRPDLPLFCGSRSTAPMSNMAMAMLMRRMKIDATPHGFRSSFRDWAGDQTDFPRETVEHALAHNVGDEVERAYRRGAALEKRRALMNEWAVFLDSSLS